MAPIKLEENIREKLQERELQPSKDAWSKLKTQLDEDGASNNSKTMWYAIAASIAALLVVGALVFNTSDNNKTQIVDEEFKNEILEEKQETTKDLAPKTPLKKHQELIASEENENTLPNKTEKKETTQKSISNPFTKKSIAVSKEQQQESETTIKEAVVTTETTFLDNKVSEVVAQVKGNELITVDEVDALLSKAQKEIQMQRIIAESTSKIDATALLEDVEGELERSFRDKVFEALGANFNKIRTAVTERNN